MEEEKSDTSIVVTNNATNKEVSDSNSTSLHLITKKRKRAPEIGTTSPPTARFKGVVVQSNGHWGAQIYAHDRIWLGTFKSQVEAAMAYDSAAIKLRNGDAQRNFPWTSITVEEPGFQSQFSTVQVLAMIKDGSYPAKFAEYLRKNSKTLQLVRISGGLTSPDDLGLVSKLLFQKELTPSDVGKLNRLVIPKRFAMMHFPQISRDVLEKERNGMVDDTEMEFFDRSMKSWKFRYCYWKSSQSFVFTRGWNRFVRDKGLRANDRVVFLHGEYKDVAGSEEDSNHRDHLLLPELELGLGPVIPKQGLRLFGVQII
ncbi:OLC1v1035942C1 [Oldenlandia corymbosa var. corymbosa]|uniref:OLC1v1035942C1 n=1 Tax=Oldenlandia corymbosa var. corymbosa TaxID=529605 RepID=A0AAV1CU81_OLDCO|nr:OLC1v1035942C1 [Oldenlandia corymbosa var. corymbosa]